MGIQIEDGKGSGLLAEVSSENLLRTLSVAGSVAGHISNDDGGVFSTFGTATVASGTIVALFIQNNASSELFVLDRLLVEGIDIGGGTAIPNQGAFFSLGFNRTFSSGGTSLTPVVLNRTSVTIANVSVVGSNPNLAGTFLESHRWYIQANGIAFEMIRPEIDDIILGRSNTLEIRYTSNNTSGTILALAKFIMASHDELP